MSKLNFILELGLEEIPAGYFSAAVNFLEEKINSELKALRLPFEHFKIWAGPRRLAVGIWGLAEKQSDIEEEIIGPSLSVAYDANGSPSKAAEGFAKGQGVSVSDLISVETAKGKYLAIKKCVSGVPVDEVLLDLFPKLLTALPFPKTMTWGAGDYRFVRPVHWLLAVLDGKILPINFAGVAAGKVSYGHRFMSPGAVVITTADEYEARLEESHVIVDFTKRKQRVLQEIDRVVAAANADLKIIHDDDLIDEVANLIEQPSAILGTFDSHFLELPREVAATAMKEHQRYFAFTDSQGRLAPYFVAINNTKAIDMDVVKKGHERVLRARLEDARFYFNEDCQQTLTAKEPLLKQVVFHKLLGTLWDKKERVKILADKLADKLNPSLKNIVKQSADLCKCDLLTGVVKEFPSLQGVMGYEYALAQGLDTAIAQAISEHYLPDKSAGRLPNSEAGAILGIADKLDTISGCFAVGLLPSGTSDPFALRRQSLGIINILLDKKWNISLSELILWALDPFEKLAKKSTKELKTDILDFFKVRLKNQLSSQKISPDVAEAVLTLYADKPVEATGRVIALEKFKSQTDFKDLAQTFKRVVNIIRKIGTSESFDNFADLTKEVELDLLKSVKSLESELKPLIEAADYDGLLAKIATIKPMVDSFFEEVLVDDPNPKIKAARLSLLTKISFIFDLAADFSKISSC